MALALATSARLKPEVRLAQAVSEFEADLTTQQKIQFSSYKQRVHQCPPGISDVMRLTAEIDQKTCLKVSRSRCYGPRFTNFLQAVQQFVDLGDIIVGGSQNLIACGVWSLVRLSLLSIVNSASYLEKVSKLLMAIGRSAPRYQDLATVYPQSKELQSNLFEYFIVVVRLCHQIFKFTQKSGVMQFTSTLNMSSLDSFQTELDTWATAIREQVTFLMAKRSEEEADKNSKFRELSLKSRSLKSHQNRLAAMRKVINQCSTYDYQTKWKQTRKLGNATIFQSNTVYQNWKASLQSSTLLYTGKLGSGKSVLMANIIDDLNLSTQDNSTIAYFFCRYDEAESLKTKTITGCLVRQLLSAINPSNYDWKKFEKNMVVDPLEIILTLKDALPEKHKVIIILDGIDECENSAAKELIQCMRKMQENFTTLLCISLRVEPDNLLQYASQKLLDCSLTSIPPENIDINAFIERELEERIEANELVLGNPELAVEIRDALIAGSQGMFLWAALQLDILSTMKTDKEIRSALEHLPKDLSTTFSRILKRHESKMKPDQRSVLEVLVSVQRPLHSEELQELLSVTPGDSNYDPENLINNVNSVLICCGSLVTIDEENATIQLIHHSVKKFLLEEYCDMHSAKIDIDRANYNLSRLILTYLSYSHLDRQVSTTVVPRINVESAPSHIIKSTTKSSSSVQELALRFLRSKSNGSRDIGKTLQAMYNRRRAPDRHTAHFLSYAREFWLDHLCATSEPNIPELSFLDDIISRGTIYLDETSLLVSLSHIEAENTPSRVKQDDRHGSAMIFWALGKISRRPLILKLLQFPHLNWNQYSYDINTLNPLHYAFIFEDEIIAMLLLEFGHANPNARMSDGRTPLMKACQAGNPRMVGGLLSAHWFEDQDYLDPQLLLYKKVVLSRKVFQGQRAESISLNARDRRGRTALSYAAQYNYRSIQLLLDHDADIFLVDNEGLTPLMYAAISENENSFRAIWTHPRFSQSDIGARIEPRDCRGRTAFSYAAEFATPTIVDLFLEDHEINPDSKDYNSRSPLFYAIEYRKDVAFRSFRADLKDQELDPSHANLRALIVDSILRTGRIDCDSKAILGQTVLMRAAIRGYKDIVLKILRYGCDPFIRDNKGMTALDYAVMHWSEEDVAATWTPLLKENGISDPEHLIRDAILEKRRREGLELEDGT